MEIQLAQIIFQILNFGVVLAALTYFVYKPVVKLLDERKAKIAQAAKSADEIQKEKEQLEETKTDLLRKAKAESKKIADEARREAIAGAKDLLDKSKVDLKAKEAKFATEMQDLRKERLQAVEQEIKKAAFSLAETVLEAEIDQKKHQKILDAQLKKIIESV
jgi:F-type H+-transporting ATPase subunit b